jgi:hypothetical protein
MLLVNHWEDFSKTSKWFTEDIETVFFTFVKLYFFGLKTG